MKHDKKCLLPLAFYEFDDDENYAKDNGCAGCHMISDFKHIIKIYNIKYRSINYLKQSIRHEIIHYLLYCSNMKYEDDAAIFHILCEKYDARAYKTMTEEEQIIYDSFKNLNKAQKLNLEYLRKIGKKDIEFNIKDFENINLMSIGINNIDSKLKVDMIKSYNSQIENLLNEYNFNNKTA